jgi:hypothetical protein
MKLISGKLTRNVLICRDERTGCDLSTPTPEGFEISPEALSAAADAHGQIVIGTLLAERYLDRRGEGVLPEGNHAFHMSPA